MLKRTLQELNLLDDFLFNAVLSHPDTGAEFGRRLLKIIFQRDFGELTIIPQKVYYGSNTTMHGARLDVYLEEDKADGSSGGQATIYDIEPDCGDRESYQKALPRRVRFYHAKLDAGSLKSGTDYGTLKNVIVVMITPYDPFGRDRMVYTVQNGCVEEPDMPYEDGAKTLFLYTKGTKGNPPKELRQLLSYMEDTNQRNATTPEPDEMHRMVEYVKRDGEVLLAYMKIFEREALLVEQGREEEQKNTERERIRADTEKSRADAAESRADTEKSRADAAESRADAEKSRADAAENRANNAETQIRQLQEELEKLKREKGKNS